MNHLIADDGEKKQAIVVDCSGGIRADLISNKLEGKRRTCTYPIRSEDILKSISYSQCQTPLELEKLLPSIFPKESRKFSIVILDSFLDVFLSYTDIKRSKNYANFIMKKLAKKALKKEVFVIS